MADKIKFGIDFDVDKSSLNNLKTSLEQLQKMTVKDVMQINTSDLQAAKVQLNAIRETASKVQSALSKAFNQKLETINIQTFNQELNKSGLDIKKIHQNLQLAGSQGIIAFHNLANQVTSTNTQLKQSHNLLDKMGYTLSNTIKWNIASGAINKMSGSIQEAYGYVKALDGSLNDIRIVTGKSSEAMADFAKQANDAAKTLGTSTTNYTKSALTFYQQGLEDEEVQARAELSNKVSNVTGLSGDQAAEYVTAVLNGYKVGSEEAEHAMDKLAAVAASTASDLAELSEGMSKVASGANAMGVSEDQLAATLSTVISVTRQSASTVGTAFKTIYARIADIKAGVEEADVSLGEYSGRMADLGFSVLDSEGNLRDLGEVMEEIGGSWKMLTREQQVSLAKTMAGTRQYNNLIALFDNWGDYMKALNVSMEANGTLQEQQNIYMESTKAHLQGLSTSMEDVYDSLLDPESINSIADGIAGIANVTADWIDSIGGGIGILETLGSVAVMVFSKQIAHSINTTIENFLTAKNNAEQLRQAMEAVQQFKGIENLDHFSSQILDMKESMYQLAEVMSPESFEKIQNGINSFVEATNNVENYQNELNILDKTIEKLGYDNDTWIDHMDEMNQVLESNIHNFQALKVQTDGVKDALTNIKVGSGNSLGEDIDQARSSLDWLIMSAQEMNSTGELTDATWARMEQAIKEYNQALTQADQIGEDFSNNTALQGAADKLVAIFNGQISTAIQSTKQLMEQLIKEAGFDSNTIKTLLRTAQEEAQKTGQEVQAILQNAAREEIIANFTKIAGAISSIGFAIQNIQNIGNIWQNEDLSTGEKILQTATNLATTLPVLLSGYTSLKSAIQGVASAKKIYTAATAAMTTAETAQAGATTVATGAQLGFNAAVLANPITWVIVGIIAAAAAAYGVYTSHVEAAAKAEEERLAKSVDNTLALKEEADALDEVYISYKNLYETYARTGEGQEELYTSVLDLADAFNIQISTLDLLAGKYDEINKKILEARAAQSKTALDETKSGIEDAKTRLSKQGFSENSNDSRRNLYFDLGFAYDSDDAAVHQMFEQFLNDADLDFEGIGQAGISGLASKDVIKAYKVIQDSYLEMEKTLESNVLNNSELYTSIGKWLSDNKEYFDSYNTLQESVTSRAQEFAEAQSALTAKNLSIENINSYEQYKDYKAKYIEQLREALGGDKQIVFDEEVFSDVDDYLNSLANQYFESIDSIKEYVNDANMAEEVRNAMFAFLGDDPSPEQKAQIQQYIDKLTDNDLKLIATVGINEKASEETIRKTLDYAKAQAENTLSDIPTAAINTILDSYNVDKKLNKGQQEALSGARNELNSYFNAHDLMEDWDIVSQEGVLRQAEFLQDLASKQNEYAQQTEESIRQELEAQKILLQSQKDDLYTSTSEFGVENIDELAAKINEYEEAMSLAEQKNEEFNESIIFGSKEAYEQAKAQKEAYDEIGQSIAEIGKILDENDFDFQVDMSNVEEILDVGDSILSEAEKIKSAAELIGEGFTVAAEDADELAAVFPEILDNATVTADGVIHLDQQTVNELLSGQDLILNGDVTTAIAKIDNQIAILQAKKESAEAELELANAVARGEISIEEALAKARADGEKQLVDYLVQLGLDQTNAQKATAEAMAGNMDEYNRITKDVSDDVANNLAQAMASAANDTQRNSSAMISSLNSILLAAHQTAAAVRGVGEGQELGATSGAAGGGSQGTSGFSGTTSKGNFTGAVPQKVSTDSIQLNDWQDQLLDDISGYTSAIAELTALKAKLLANQKDTQAALDGANAGRGGKIEKDKNKDKSKKGSGKGDKGKKEKEADFIDLLDDEYDAYHDINIEIKQLENDLDKLQKIQEKLTGKELIDNLNKQLDILEKQKNAYFRKIELAKTEASAYKKILESYGATFDSQSGQIINYYSLLQNQLNKTNEVISKYNELSAEQQTDLEKQKVETAKQQYEQLKSLIENYEKTINDVIPELQDQIEDALFKEIEIQISKFDMQVELRLDMAEAEREWNHFKRHVIDNLDDDNLFGKAAQSYNDILSYYNTNKTGTGSVQAQAQHVQSILNELENMKNGKHSSIYSAYDESTSTWVDDKAQAEKNLKESYSNLIKDLENVKELEEEIRNAFLDSIDAIDESFDKQKENYEFVGEQIEHDIKMIELLYGNQAYDKMNDYYKKQIHNTQEELNAQKETAKFWKEKMEAERNAIAMGNGDEEALAKYEENWKEAVTNVNQLLENWADEVTRKYENTIDNMVNNLNDALSNGLGLDYLNEELSLLDDNSNNYLDNINAAYAKQKLENKWQDAINNTDSISSQKELNKLMQEQMKMLEEKGKLTQYDIDRAEKEYEIALKQMALQEAQQNKSKMRLKRDANGNYSYQFVSDEESIKNAEDELAAARNELYNFDKSAYQNNLNEMYSTWDEFQQKVADAYKTYAEDQDALNEHIALLQEQYGEKINFLTAQNLNIRNNLTNSAMTELANMYGTDVENFKAMTEKEKDLILNDLIPQWDSGVQQMIDKFSGEGGFESICQETFNNLAEAADEYQKDIEDIKSANQSASEEAYSQGQQILDQSDELIRAAQDEYERIGEVLSQVHSLTDAYYNAKRAAIEATKAAFGYVQASSAMDAASAENSTNSNSGGASGGTSFSNGNSTNSSSSGSSVSVTSGSSSNRGSGNGIIDIGDKVTYNGRYYYDPYGGSPSGSKYSGVPNGVVVDMKDSHGPYGVHIHSADGIYRDLGWIKKSQLTGYDTGGYTGSWNNDGRLALLHQKELVLNAKDTQNMLNAMEVLRSIIQNIGENTLMRTSSMLSNLNLPSVDAHEKETIEQNVHIVASFEGQTEATQIQTALDNLVNIAAQRANRFTK